MSHQLVLLFFFLIIVGLVYQLDSKQDSAILVKCPVWLNHFLEITWPEGQEGLSFQDSKRATWA